jgi:hypothetical protein
MPGVWGYGKSKLRQPRARQRERGDGQDEMVERPDSRSSSREVLFLGQRTPAAQPPHRPYRRSPVRSKRCLWT